MRTGALYSPSEWLMKALTPQASLTRLPQTGGHTAAQSSKALLGGCQRHHIYGLACTGGRDSAGLHLLSVRFRPALTLSKNLHLLSS